MTDITFHPQNLTKEAQNVSSALRELAVATRRLAVALWVALTQRQPADPVQTARQEADKLRAYADNHHRADPRYLEDLYAAANRHEAAAGER